MITRITKYPRALPTLDASLFTSDWRNETEGSPHAGTLSYVLRGPKGPITPEAVFNGHDIESIDLTEEWEEVLSFCLYLVGGAGIKRAMIVALMPGQTVKPHTDEGSYCAAYTRYHLPLITNNACSNTFGEVTQPLAEGHIYYVDNQLEHSAVNMGQEARAHLIFDIEEF